MIYNGFVLTSGSAEISVYKWVPINPCAAVQISHGAVEHARRYNDFARFLASMALPYAEHHRGQQDGGSAGKTSRIWARRAAVSADGGGHALPDAADQKRLARPAGVFAGAQHGLADGARVCRRYGSELAGLVLTGTGRANPR